MVKIRHIIARTLQAARNIARQNKNLEVYSGKWISSIPVIEGNLKTYSFRVKEWNKLWHTKIKNQNRKEKFLNL